MAARPADSLEATVIYQGVESANGDADSASLARGPVGLVEGTSPDFADEIVDKSAVTISGSVHYEQARLALQEPPS